MQDWAKIFLLWQAASHASQVKFLQYSEWEFDLHVEVLKILWSEMKDVKIYAMS